MTFEDFCKKNDNKDILKEKREEIKIKELPKEQMELLKKLNLSIIKAYKNEGGFSVDTKGKILTKYDIKYLSNNKIFRWIDTDSGDVLNLGI